jgi:hypothetical protein
MSFAAASTSALALRRLGDLRIRAPSVHVTEFTAVEISAVKTMS